MKISKDHFFSVGSDLHISKEQIEQFWVGLEQHKDTQESTPFTKTLFYLGAMIVISAMTWFMNLGWEQFGGGGIFLISLAYACIFTWIGRFLWNQKNLRIPSGLFITMAVCMVPLAIYGLEAYLNIFPEEQQNQYQDFYRLARGKWVFMEIGTILAGILALYFFPFPFLTAPIFFSAWFLTIDILPFLFGYELNWEQRGWISIGFGLLFIAIGLVLDGKKKEDYTFWSYLFGAFSFWVGLNVLIWDRGEVLLFVYFLINLIMISFSILVKRNVFMVFGAIGVFSYLGHLAYTVFEDSILFPFILSFIGLGIVYLGIVYQRNLSQIQTKITQIIPSSIRTFFRF